jgi:hypothetical protein
VTFNHSTSPSRSVYPIVGLCANDPSILVYMSTQLGCQAYVFMVVIGNLARRPGELYKLLQFIISVGATT